MIDKIIMTSKGQLTIVYTCKGNFTVTGDSPLELLTWLNTTTVVSINDWKQATISANEETQDIKVVA